VQLPEPIEIGGPGTTWILGLSEGALTARRHGPGISRAVVSGRAPGDRPRAAETAVFLIWSALASSAQAIAEPPTHFQEFPVGVWPPGGLVVNPRSERPGELSLGACRWRCFHAPSSGWPVHWRRLCNERAVGSYDDRGAGSAFFEQLGFSHVLGALLETGNFASVGSAGNSSLGRRGAPRSHGEQAFRGWVRRKISSSCWPATTPGES